MPACESLPNRWFGITESDTPCRLTDMEDESHRSIPVRSVDSSVYGHVNETARWYCQLHLQVWGSPQMNRNETVFGVDPDQIGGTKS